MPSFRSPAAQAKHLVIRKVKHGKSRHQAKGSHEKFIASVGTELTYRGNIKRFIEWLQKNKLDAKRITPAIAQKFLALKSETVVQKTLDGYRQAISLVFDLEVDYVVSKRDSIIVPRAYRDEQIVLLAERANPALSLSIRIAVHAGLRAIELDTIGKPGELNEDKRAWLPERFIGRENEVTYVVVGKGGLRRTVLLTQELAVELEGQRLAAPVIKRQRGINYKKRFAIVGGHSFSLQFSRLSTASLRWSTGAHGLRHRYAQRRLRFLQTYGFAYKDALLVVSQELGHFSTTNTLAYLR